VDPILFLTAAIVGLMLLAGFLSLAEWFAITRFTRAVYHLGPIVLRDQRSLPPLHDQFLGGVYETPTGAFTFVSSEECLFRTRYVALRPAFRSYPQLKGVVTWRGLHAYVVGRAPLSTTVFHAGWFTLLLLFAALMLFSGEHPLIGVAILAGAGTLGAIVLSTTLGRERRYLTQVLDDLEAALSRPSV
jgi:hypothetical protein